MDLPDFNNYVYQPSMNVLRRVHPKLFVPAAADRIRFMLLLIAMTESNLEHRKQVPVSYARGFWQFERAGVAALWRHTVLQAAVRDVCRFLHLDLKSSIDVWEAVEYNDVVALTCARLLLWHDPKAIPKIEQRDELYQMYVNCWRPGKPSFERWCMNYNSLRSFFEASVVSEFEGVGV